MPARSPQTRPTPDANPRDWQWEQGVDRAFSPAQLTEDCHTTGTQRTSKTPKPTQHVQKERLARSLHDGGFQHCLYSYRIPSHFLGLVHAIDNATRIHIIAGIPIDVVAQLFTGERAISHS